MNQTQESKNIKSETAEDFEDFLTTYERVTKPNEEECFIHGFPVVS